MISYKTDGMEAKCRKYSDDCDCLACLADRRPAMLERARGEWRPGCPLQQAQDASVWVPISRSGGESGHLPVQEIAVAQRFCDQLNAQELSRVEEELRTRNPRYDSRSVI